MVAAEVSNGGSDVEWGDSGDEVEEAYRFSDDVRPPEGGREAMAGLLYFVVCMCVCVWGKSSS